MRLLLKHHLLQVSTPSPPSLLQEKVDVCSTYDISEERYEEKATDQKDKCKNTLLADFELYSKVFTK